VAEQIEFGSDLFLGELQLLWADFATACSCSCLGKLSILEQRNLVEAMKEHTPDVLGVSNVRARRHCARV